MYYFEGGVRVSAVEIWQLDRSKLRKYVTKLCLIDKEAFGGNAWAQENFERILPCKSEISRIALCERKPVGYLIGSTYGHSYAQIHRFAVLSRFRKKGIGKKLLMSFEDACSRMAVSEITLESLVDRHGANCFYEQMGFMELSGSKLVRYLHGKGKDKLAQSYSGLSPLGKVLVYQKALKLAVNRMSNNDEHQNDTGEYSPKPTRSNEECHDTSDNDLRM